MRLSRYFLPILKETPREAEIVSHRLMLRAGMRLADRGVLKQGMWADVVIFDPDSIRDVATFDNPNQLAVGMSYVLVNGVPVIAEGKMTNALPGKVVRGPGYRAENR